MPAPDSTSRRYHGAYVCRDCGAPSPTPSRRPGESTPGKSCLECGMSKDYVDIVEHVGPRRGYKYTKAEVLMLLERVVDEYEQPAATA